MIHPKLRELLRCPLDLAPLAADGEALVCTRCGQRYPVVDDIPVMLPEAECPPAEAAP